MCHRSRERVANRVNSGELASFLTFVSGVCQRPPVEEGNGEDEWWQWWEHYFEAPGWESSEEGEFEEPATPPEHEIPG